MGIPMETKGWVNGKVEVAGKKGGEVFTAEFGKGRGVLGGEQWVG